jgi:hypothetical protein
VGNGRQGPQARAPVFDPRRIRVNLENGERMKQFIGKWKWSKKRQAWILKWKRRKVSEQVHYE